MSQRSGVYCVDDGNPSPVYRQQRLPGIPASADRRPTRSDPANAVMRSTFQHQQLRLLKLAPGQLVLFPSGWAITSPRSTAPAPGSPSPSTAVVRSRLSVPRRRACTSVPDAFEHLPPAWRARPITSQCALAPAPICGWRPPPASLKKPLAGAVSGLLPPGFDGSELLVSSVEEATAWQVVYAPSNRYARRRLQGDRRLGTEQVAGTDGDACIPRRLPGDLHVVIDASADGLRSAGSGRSSRRCRGCTSHAA